MTRVLEATSPLQLRELAVKPRVKGYVHRDIIAVSEGAGLTCQGEYIDDLARFAVRCRKPTMWATHDPMDLLDRIQDTLGEHAISVTFINARIPDDPCQFDADAPRSFKILSTKVTHYLWVPGDIAQTIDTDTVGTDMTALLTFAKDIRDWCRKQDIPLKVKLSGIGAALIRDPRFWPHARGRVPAATNERIRPYLPGVHSESRAERMHTYHGAVSLDQVKAYHQIATDTPTPNPTNLMARGWFDDPTNYAERGLWARAGTTLYQRTLEQHGLLAVLASSRPCGKTEWRPPVCDGIERRVRYVWTSEWEDCLAGGLKVEGIMAAWTSEDADAGLPRFGAWCIDELASSNQYRRQWLKPALHSTYGLLGAQARTVTISRTNAPPTPTSVPAWITPHRSKAVSVHQFSLRNMQPATVNVAMLGILQAEVRARSLDMANQYNEHTIGVHADSIHLDNVQMALTPPGWEPNALDGLIYADDVSWTADQVSHLPGRHGDHRLDLVRRLEIRRRQVAEQLKRQAS